MRHLSTIAFSIPLFCACIALPAHAEIELMVSDGIPADTVTVSAPSSPLGLTSLSMPSMWLSNGVYVSSAAAMATSGPFPAALQFNSIDIATNGPATVTFTVSADGFTQAVGTAAIGEQLAATTLPDASVQLTGYEGSSLFDTTNAGPTIGLTSPDAAGVTAASAMFPFTTPFSLTEVITLTFTGAGIGQLNFGGTLTPTPEPASMTLFAGVLIGAGLLFRKRFQPRS